jgi:hypothetical protein
VHLASLRPQRLIARLAGKRPLRPAFLLTGVMGLSLLGAQLGLGTAQAANLKYYWQAGYYLDNGWLCYGWSTGAYHCTQHWHRASNGTLVSDNVAWVPNGGSTSGAAVTHQTPASPAPVKKAPAVPARPAPAKPAPVHAAPSVPAGSVQAEIVAVFGRYANAALAVARCESGYNPSAKNPNSTASGVFQFLTSTWATTSYAGYSPFNAWANIHAAYQVFSRDGYSWREWECQP